MKRLLIIVIMAISFCRADDSDSINIKYNIFSQRYKYTLNNKEDYAQKVFFRAYYTESFLLNFNDNEKIELIKCQKITNYSYYPMMVLLIYGIYNLADIIERSKDKYKGFSLSQKNRPLQIVSISIGFSAPVIYEVIRYRSFKNIKNIIAKRNSRISSR